MSDIDEPAGEFIWGDEPPRDWFEAQGAALGLTGDQIRFAAALHQLGGADAKRNTQAARLANLPWDRVQAFRQARTVGVRRLLDEADKIKRRQRPPLTEEEIDATIDNLIRSPDPLNKMRAIELREKRAAQRVEREQLEREAERDPLEILAEIAKHNPFRALELRAEKKLPPTDDAVEVLRAHRCRNCAERVARELGIDLIDGVPIAEVSGDET